MSVKTELILKTTDYELKIIQLEKEYKQKCKKFDEKKMEQFVKRKMKAETAELLKFNIKTALGE